MNRHLDVVVMPDGVFRLEWSETADTVNRSTALLQEEVFKRFASDADLISVLASAPMMTGAEYLGKEVLKQVWIALNRVFSREIQAFSGTVLEFINRYSPDVHLAAQRSAMLTELIDTGELFHPLAWSAREAFLFLREISIYEQSGILCRIPDWWKGKAAGIRLNLSFGETRPSFVGLDAVLSFDAQLLLGDTVISVSPPAPPRAG